MTQTEMFPEQTKSNLPVSNDIMKEMDISAKDLEIPLLMLMQSTSEYVNDGKAKMGDIVHSQTQEVLGGEDKPIDIVPLSVFKTLRTYDTSGTSPKLLKVEPWTTKNDDIDFEGNEGAIPVKRYHTYNYFVLLRSELGAGAFPFVLRLKSSSSTAGRILATHFMKMQAMGRPHYSSSLSLSSQKNKKDKLTWTVFHVTGSKPLNQDELKEVAQWAETLKKISVKVDDAEESPEGQVSPGPVVMPEVKRSGAANIF